MMTVSILTSVVLQTSILAAAPENEYSQAYYQSLDSGKPLVVLVGAPWCPGCQTMKHSVVPALRDSGSLGKVEFAQLNTDRQLPLARQLMSGSSIPQLIMYARSPGGWKRYQLTGSQSVDLVESFIDRGVQTAASATPSSSTARQDEATRR